MDIVKGNMGWIEVVVGPMFSGKSEELIRRLRRAEIARQRVQIFKPAIDERYAANEIISHSGLGIPSDNVLKAAEIMEKVQPRTEVIGIDEAQFLGDEVVDVCTKLANLGKRVIVAGLDTDYRGRPFEPMPRLLAIAEEITKLLAICVRCGNPAVHTQRLVESEELDRRGRHGHVRSPLPPLLRANPASPRKKRRPAPDPQPRRRLANADAIVLSRRANASYRSSQHVLLDVVSLFASLTLMLELAFFFRHTGSASTFGHDLNGQRCESNQKLQPAWTLPAARWIFGRSTCFIPARSR